MYVVDRCRADAFFGALTTGRGLFALERGPAVSSPSESERNAAARAPEGIFRLVRADAWAPGRHTVGAYRPVEPLKAVVFPPRLRVGAFGEPPAPAELPERIVVGVKNCDLSALRVHDRVFLETEPADPFYAEARRKTILVSCDCTSALDVCFCSAVREQPYARSGFDINLSPIAAGYVVESGSPKGDARLAEAEVRALLEPAGAEAVAERDRNRKAMTERVRGQAARAGLSADDDFRGAVRATAESGLWGEFAERCVECGACNFVCCTCHCFLLGDGRAAGGAAVRTRMWDSCLYRNFARVAGGANPRGHRAERLHNRFDKKFNYFPGVCGVYACDGCGRCVEACAGRIDIREVLKRAVNERQSIPVGAGRD